MDDSLRLCTKCGEVGVFARNKHNKDGWHSECKKCAVKRMQAYRSRPDYVRPPESKRKCKPGEGPINRNKQLLLLGQRWCATCAQPRPLDYFKKKPSGYKQGCKECRAILWRKDTYGLAHTDYLAMLSAQQGRCAICADETKLHVDHCHATDAVRGLLCTACNKAIGLLKDNPARALRAAAYLTKAATVPSSETVLPRY